MVWHYFTFIERYSLSPRLFSSVFRDHSAHVPGYGYRQLQIGRATKYHTLKDVQGNYRINLSKLAYRYFGAGVQIEYVDRDLENGHTLYIIDSTFTTGSALSVTEV